MSVTAEELERNFQQTSPQKEEKPSVSVEELESNFPASPQGRESQEERGSVEENQLFNIGLNLNVGLSRLFGFPGAIDEALFTEDSYFPTPKEIQGTLASAGMTFEPGEEPQGFLDRFTQEAGTVALPVGGMMARGSNLLAKGIQEGRGLLQRSAIEAARRPGATLAVETGATAGAAGGGMVGEEMFPDSPQMGRAIFELAGGLGGGFAASGGGVRLLARGGKALSEPFTPKGGTRRATERLSRGTRSAGEARRRMAETEDLAEEVPELTPAQRTNDPFMAQLEQSVREESPEVREALAKRAADASRRLKQIANRTGDVEDIRKYLDARFKAAAARASASTQGLRGTQDTAAASSKARQAIEEAYETARNQEKEVWGRVPTSVTASPSSARQVWKDELSNLTEGSDRSELPVILRNKLGELNKKGNLTPGALGKNPSAKALHDFYSVLGRKIGQESGKSGPNRNKLRILGQVRRAILEDLDEADGGEAYKEAIALSRDVNRKFTEGPVSKVLGLSGGRATNTTETLDALMGMSGEQQRNAVKQLLEASPQAEGQVKDFIRNRFMDAAFNRENNRIVPKNAANFLNKYRPILKEFPDLRSELQGAAKNQKNLDELLAVSDVTDLSARAREQRAAGVFLQAPPGEEVQRVINTSKRGPKTVTQQFESLVRDVKDDETGNALKGLKSAFTDFVMSPSRREDATGELLIDGREMVNRLDEYGSAATKSGMMTKDELSRLRKIARVFEGIQTTERSAQAAEGVISDKPALLLRIASRAIPARMTTLTPSGGAGVGLQEAQIAASEGQSFVRRLTNKGAYHLLTRAVQDEDVMNDLLKRVQNMGVKEQRRLFSRLSGYLPQGAIAPAASEAVQQQEEGKTAREGMR